MVPEQTKPTLGALLRALYDALAKEVYARLAQAGFADIRPAHSPAFRYLPESGARTVDLAARAGMAKQSMGYLLEDLEKLGYVAFEPDPTDGRARLAHLTDRGRNARKTLESLSADVEAGWSQRIGKEEWASARQTLEALANLIEGPWAGSPGNA